MRETLTRKEIRWLTNGKLTENIITRREKELGLDKCRVKFFKRPVQYWKDEAMIVLEPLFTTRNT